MSEGVAEPGGREPQGNSPPENAPETAGPDKTLLPFEDRKRHLLWIWIPVVIGLGLLIAAGYVGGRVWTSKPEDGARRADDGHSCSGRDREAQPGQRNHAGRARGQPGCAHG